MKQFVMAVMFMLATVFPAAAQSGDYRIDALWVNPIDAVPVGNPQVGVGVTYSFYKNGVSAPYVDTGCNESEVSNATKDAIRAIFNQITMYSARVYFWEVEEPAAIGTIRIIASPTCTAYLTGRIPGNTPNGAGRESDILVHPNYDNNTQPNGTAAGWGSHGYRALWHEIGHVLGLRHPIDLTATGEYHSDLTVMSLNFVNNYGQASPATPRQTTFRSFDKLALQFYYGCPIAGCGSYDPWY